MYHEHSISCPYCGESITVFVDVSQGDQHTIEDCWVCCRPIEMLVTIKQGQIQRLDTFTDDETLT